MLTVAVMARNYHMLPSQVIEQATTYDVMINDVYESWKEYQEKGTASVPNYNVEQLQEILQKTKEKK